MPKRLLNKLKKSDIGRILNKILHPHTALLLIIVPFSAALLIYVFVFGKSGEAIAYIAYFLSAYALTAGCINFIPKLFGKARQLKTENVYVNRYVSDAGLRVTVSLYCSVLMNTAYAVFQLGLGFYHRSVWFYSLAVYYILLAVMRFFLLRDIKDARKNDMLSQLKRSRFCGIMLLFMSVALSVIVFYITRQNRGFEHHPVTAIAMAAYTFSSFTLALINVIKYKKFNSPIYSSAKFISLAAASVSMLTLETTMFAAFEQGQSPVLRRTLTEITGISVCLLVLFMAIYITVYSTIEIGKEMNKEHHDEQ